MMKNTWDNNSSHLNFHAFPRQLPIEDAGGDADMRCGRGVNGRPPTAACKGACVYKNACLC
jgi:hypothetical protein